MIAVDELNDLVERMRPYSTKGNVTNYIPALAKMDPNQIAVAIFTKDQKLITAGDQPILFTMQSIVKIFALILAIQDLGEEDVFKKVGMEATGESFHSIGRLENRSYTRPSNPMINSGALIVASLIFGSTIEEKMNRILTLIRTLADNHLINYNQTVAKSEFVSTHINRSLAYFLKQHGEITGDVEKLIDFYTRMCAIEVNCCDLARIGAVISNNGVDPVTKRVLLPEKTATMIKTLMVTCGLYNESGEFAIKVGIPAKSGISGAILGVLPDGEGIGVYSPALNENGNSIAGIELLKKLSEIKKFHLFNNRTRIENKTVI